MPRKIEAAGEDLRRANSFRPSSSINWGPNRAWPIGLAARNAAIAMRDDIMQFVTIE